jgi:hypothetical protein
VNRRQQPLILLAGALFSAALFAVLPAKSFAVPNPLPPGASLDKPGTVPALLPPYYTSGPIPANFTVPVASMNFPYLFNGTSNGAFLGSVLSQVWMDPNTLKLAFSYRFDNLNVGNPTDIVRATIDDPTHPWTGFTVTDVGADGSGSSTPQGAGPFWANGDPYLIERDSLFSGVDAQWRVGGRGTELLSTTNDSSSTIWFATDATHFRVTNVALADGGDAGSSNAFAPNVPEPATLVLLTLGTVVSFLAVPRHRLARVLRA